MCNLYSITTNPAAIIALFRALNRYVGNRPPMPGVFPDFPPPGVRNAASPPGLISMRWADQARHPNDLAGTGRLDASAMGRVDGAAKAAARRCAQDRCARSGQGR